MPAVVALLWLLAAPALAEHPWEAHVNLAVPVPVELPAVPPTNPFATRLTVEPVLLQAPLRTRFEITVPVEAAAYIDAGGACRRLVFTRLPLPDLTAELGEALGEAEFKPGQRLGAAVPTWAPVAVDLKGRIDEGRSARLAAAPLDPASPPVAEPAASPALDPRDVLLPSTPVDQLDQLPQLARFRAKVSGHTVQTGVRLLVEVGPDGTARRIVFLACPEGLRAWLLASAGEWRFQPAQDGSGPVTAWTAVEGGIEVEVGTLRSDALRLTRQASYPPAPAAPGAGRPPGA